MFKKVYEKPNVRLMIKKKKQITNKRPEKIIGTYAITIMKIIALEITKQGTTVG